MESNRMGPWLFSTAYLAPIDYFHFLLKASKPMVEHHETFAKQSYRNRCRILGPNGVQSLSIPVKASNQMQTRDVRIDNSVPWQKQHWRSISSAYGSAPFFIYYDYEFQPLFEKPFEFLMDFNEATLDKILKLIKADVMLEPTLAFEKKPEQGFDFRETIHPKKQQKIPQEVYTQVFGHKFGFVPNLSIIDLIFNIGPDARTYLQNLSEEFRHIFQQ